MADVQLNAVPTVNAARTPTAAEEDAARSLITQVSKDEKPVVASRCFVRVL